MFNERDRATYLDENLRRYGSQQSSQQSWLPFHILSK